MTPEEKTLFEKIIDGEIPVDFEYEDEKCVVIQDKYPQAPVHLLVLPKKHIPSLAEAVESEDKDLIAHMIFIAKMMAEKEDCQGYRVQFNVGSRAGQTIFHLHLHMMGWK